ncbi:MAG TPA: DUF87 domain-containing protein [Stellaceae bacterium]|nr:DUF87 domain-containing protein [Stellaceae bacterium]
MAEPAIFDGFVAILGRTGSGKSYAARGIVEDWLAAGRRVCIIDPTDVWHGLRSDASGGAPGYPVVVFGGDHGDLAIGEHSGEHIAEIVAGRNLPAIISTAEMTVGERHRFMTGFLGTLYRLNKTPLHLVLDEADDVAPQNPLPENRRMLGDVERIVRRGRVRGFRVTMISQRAAVLNKNVLSQASVLVAMRMPAAQDRAAIEAWIKGQADIDQARELLGSLSKLQRGEGWIWAPEEGVLERHQFRMIRTLDTMRTPEHGEEITEPTALASVEIADLRALLVESANTDDRGAGPSAREISAAELRDYARGERTLRTEVTSAEQRGYARGRLQGFADAIDHLRGRRQEWRDAIDALRNRVDAFFAGAGVPIGDEIDRTPTPPPRALPQAEESRKDIVEGSRPQITGAWQRILDALAWLDLAGLRPATKVQLAFVAGYGPSSSGFANYLGAMRSGGLIEYPAPGRIELTPEGAERAQPPERRLDTAMLHGALQKKLGAAKWSVLAAVIDAWPNAIDRDTVASGSGYSPSSSGFANYLGELRSLGLIDYPSRGTVRAEDILFIGGP